MIRANSPTVSIVPVETVHIVVFELSFKCSFSFLYLHIHKSTIIQRNQFSQSTTFTNCTLSTNALETANLIKWEMFRAFRWTRKSICARADMKDLEIIRDF